MTTRADLAERDMLLPSELRRFGNRVHHFRLEDLDRIEGEDFSETKQRLFQKIHDFIDSSGGHLYTGIHSETDWDKDRWWYKGGHLVNRTLNFIVIVN